MIDVQECKFIVLKYFREFESAEPDDLAATVRRYSAAEFRFRGVHPFNDLDSVDAVVDTVWLPMSEAITGLHRRQDIFMGAPNLVDNTIWVTSVGKFMGLLDRPWLGIPATRKLVLIPYAEFNRIDDCEIVETVLMLDILSVMKQAGLNPLPMQTGAEIINLGPRTGDGLLFDAQSKAESKKTQLLMTQRRNDFFGDDMHSPREHLAETWHDDMLWFGPSGIGATGTIERFDEQHQAPLREGLSDVHFNAHVLEHSEGNYGAWFGWPTFFVKQGGGFLGLPASDAETEMRVASICRRDGDKLAETWIFVDMLHYLAKLGLDVLERYATAR